MPTRTKKPRTRKEKVIDLSLRLASLVSNIKDWHGKVSEDEMYDYLQEAGHYGYEITRLLGFKDEFEYLVSPDRVSVRFDSSIDRVNLGEYISSVRKYIFSQIDHRELATSTALLLDHLKCVCMGRVVFEVEIPEFLTDPR